MTDAVVQVARGDDRESAGVARRRRRHAAERRFRAYGIGAIVVAVSALALLLLSIVYKGYSAFVITELRLDVALAEDVIDPTGAREPGELARADYSRIVRDSLRLRFPKAGSRREVRELMGLVSTGAADDLRTIVTGDPTSIGSDLVLWVPASDDVDSLAKGTISADVPEGERRLSNRQIAWFDALRAEGRVRTEFNWRFLTSGDSREPELAGVLGAIVGSFLTLLVTLAVAFPLGLMTAVYLEEFAPRNRLTDVIEVNINNLAAVPSIVFGLLGLAIFLGVIGMPRSAPVVGGLTLALMTLPTIIIAGRASLQAVPPSLKDAALAIGASPLQAILHHVLPVALPGMLTGTIIGMARALGETAPLLMIGMVAFIVDVPGGFTDPATGLPVQIYLWADSPERAFVAKTSAAIMVLLVFLALMNGTAVFLRRKFEIRW